jgi:hypothetical protein
LVWTNVQRADYLTKFAACDVAVRGFVYRIFFAESVQVKPPAKFGNSGFSVKSLPSSG